MILKQVAYDLDSPHGSVQACLRKKREVSQPPKNGGILGIAASSCCSFVSYIGRDSTLRTVIGNSRIRIPFQFKDTEVRTACVHGELTALWNVIEDEDNIPKIIEMYIEMSPCERCTIALNNLLPPDQTVLFSFRHPDEVNEWRNAARSLVCGRRSS